MPDTSYALSIRQPWATLLVYGLKTIEVRRWPTARRGRILIHAARGTDPDRAIWKLLPKHLHAAAAQRGGIIGSCELINCVTYATATAFATDGPRHLNRPGWFRPPALYGFTFAEPVVLPFRAYPGWFRFFPVSAVTPVRKGTPAPGQDR